jgi:hypothetical protein
MAHLRCRLGRIAFVWLLCNAATLSLGPMVLAQSGDDLLECTCAHGDHATCPMHHNRTPGSKLCLMRSLDDSRTGVLTSLLGAVGLTVASTPLAEPESHQVSALRDATSAILRPAPPDSPPPRQ